MALGIVGSDTPVFSRIAHLAVIVFFVISGYAVASSLYRHNDVTKFLSARFSRVYSIAIPALFFTLALDLMIGVKNIGYPDWQYHRWWAYIPLSLAFLGESWTMMHRPFSIIPYWSLAYEFWYYILIAAFSVKNQKLRHLLCLLALLCAGPKILMLLPCWLVGVWLYKYRELNSRLRFHMNYPIAIVIFLVLMTLYVYSGADLALQEFSQQLCNEGTLRSISNKCGYSQWFIADYPVALLFAVISALVSFTSTYQKSWISKLAPHTFGVYLLHYPLLIAASTIFKPRHSIVFSIAIIASVFATTVALSVLFDRSRPYLVKVFHQMLSRMMHVTSAKS